MNKFRKVCRGSGRALALIFAASVVWLIFDMAALKLSFGESGTKVLQGETAWGKEKGPGRVWRNSEDDPGRWSREEPETSPSFPGQDGKKRSRNGEDAGRDAEGRGQRLSPGATPAKAAPGKIPGLRDIFPLKRQRPPAQPLSRGPEKKVNGAAATGGDPRQTKPALALREQEPHSIVAGGRAPLPNGVPQKVPVQKSAGGTEVLVHTEFTNKGALVELKRGVAAGSMPEEWLANPGLLKANRTGGLVRTMEVPEVTGRWGLPAGKLNTSTSEKKEVSLKKIAQGNLPSRMSAKILPAKDALSENQQVFVTKELVPMVFPTIQHLQASTKLMGKYVQLPGEKSSNKGKATNATRIDGLIKATEGIVARGGALGKVDKGHLAGEEQFPKPNQSNVDFAENTRLHKVLTIDRTLTPRDPRAPGQFGRPAEVPGEKEEEAKRRWNEGNFNVYLSDLIPLDRAIDDTRPAG